MNLLVETRAAIQDSGHRPEDVVFIGSVGSGKEPAYECTWDEFVRLADFEYDSGYGAAEVPCDLRVVFSDGADLHRGEYDGSEWWEFSYPFVPPEHAEPIQTLKSQGKMRPSVHDLHKNEKATRA